MSRSPQKVSLVSDLDVLVEELAPMQPMWMVRPRLERKFTAQRMTTVVEVVDLDTLDLARMHMFEAL